MIPFCDMHEKDNRAVPTVSLGKTGITTSRIGLGMATWLHTRPFEQAVEVFRAAFDIGVRHLDNAAKYDTEEIVGKVLAETGVPDDAVFTSKVCTYYDKQLDISYQSFSQTAVERSVERSLRLLGREYLDIVYIHDLREINIPVVFSERGPLVTLGDLKRQGLIKAIGMATRNIDTLLVAVTSGDFDVIQTFHLNTLLNREAHRELYPLAQAAHVPVLDSGPYAGYILATGPREGASYNYGPAPREAVEATERVAEVCRRKGVSLPDAALAFALRHPAVSTVTIGSGNPEHVRGWTRALDISLTDQDFQEMVDAAGSSVALRRSLFDRSPVVDFSR